MPTITATTWPPITRWGTRGRTVWYHEDDKGRRCNGYDDRGLENDVNDQKDYQQRERGQSTLEEIVLPTAAKPSIDQPPFE